jgi:two-component system nitrogen regulation response regulator GlnG
MPSDSVLAPLHVLLVDDDAELLASASRELARAGIPDSLICDDARRVAGLLGGAIGVVVLDLSMPYISGRALLAAIRTDHPDVPVLVMTGRNDLEVAVDCMRCGARDYLVKPVESDRLVSAVRSALEWRMQQAEIATLRQTLLAPVAGRPAAFARVLTQNGTMLTLFRYLETMARTTHPLLIGGETGTGKELIAEAVHQASGRQGPFVSICVAGMDDTTFADTMFGHVRGAGTGGDRSRAGLISAAANGTLFLDEVTALPEASQVQVSRLLRDGTYFQPGSSELKKSRARILAATSADLDRAVANRAFSRELEFRFARPRVEVPPLRRRLDDLPLLVTHFVEREAKLFGKPMPYVPAALYQLLRTYDFPGNVLELERMCQHAMARHDRGTLAVTHFRELVVRTDVGRVPTASRDEPDRPAWIPERMPTLHEAEQALIAEALRRAEGNQSAAAPLLGITRDALVRRLAKVSARRAVKTTD